MPAAKSVDEVLANARYFPDEQARLRRILLATPLEETVKWGGPCYTCQGKNVVGIGGFKAYFGLWFFQGALLSLKPLDVKFFAPHPVKSVCDLRTRPP